MKAILMSIHPKWCEKIFNGSKSIEVRKSRPSIPTPFTVYVYQTKLKVIKGDSFMVVDALNENLGCGKVIGSFVCDRVRLCIPFGLKGHLLSQEVYREMCLTKEQLDKYGGLKTLYGWHITEPKLFDKPRELGEFYRSLPEKVLENGEYDCRKEWDVLCIDAPEGGDYCAECPYGGRVQITRAPQSWVYCETIDEK